MAKTNGRRIVLTGCTRGLGAALTDKFTALGHHVLGCGRSRDLIDRQRQRHGAPHDFAVVDVAREPEVQAWAARLLAEHGPPDLLLNNAALLNRGAAVWQVPGDEFDRVIDVGIKGVAHVLRHFLPAMVARKTGVVVNLSSGLGRATMANHGPYCAVKWAIEGLTRTLAQELPAGLAAIPLNPGVIDTDMLRLSIGGAARGYLSPGDWAERAVPFLLQLGPKDNGKPLSVPGA